jgi:ATP-dependent DNA helicase HFM1/MER3
VSTCNNAPPICCSSRKGTIEAASAIAKEAEAHAQVASYSAAGTGSTGSSFVRDMQQLQRLRSAAASAQAKALVSLLVAGVGFHNAAMEPADRALVEDLFKANDLAVGAVACLQCQPTLPVKGFIVAGHRVGTVRIYTCKVCASQAPSAQPLP